MMLILQSICIFKSVFSKSSRTTLHYGGVNAQVEFYVVGVGSHLSFVWDCFSMHFMRRQYIISSNDSSMPKHFRSSVSRKPCMINSGHLVYSTNPSKHYLRWLLRLGFWYRAASHSAIWLVRNDSHSSPTTLRQLALPEKVSRKTECRCSTINSIKLRTWWCKHNLL